jgi:hypothetical protein
LRFGTQFLDGATNVTLAAGDISANTTTQASLLQTRLRTLSVDYSLVTVTYSTVGGNHYEIHFPVSLQLQYTPSGGSLTNAVSDELLGKDLQSLPGSAVVTGTSFTYGGVTVTLVTGDIATGPELDGNGDEIRSQVEVQAELLETRLRTVTSLSLVNVMFTVDEVTGAVTYYVGMPVPPDVSYLTNAASVAESATPISVTVGSLTLPLNISTAIFRKGATTKTVSLIGSESTVRAAFQSQLAGLNGTFRILGSGIDGDAWQVEFTEYNEATPVTVEYDFGQSIDVTPDVIVTPSIAIANADVLAGTQFLVGSESVQLNVADITTDTGATARASQAALLQTKLRTISALSQAVVTFDSTQYFINFAAAETVPVAIVSATAFEAAGESGGLATQVIAGGRIVAHTAFRAGTDFVTLGDADIDNASTSGQAALLQTKLRTLTGLSTVTVAYAAGNYLITFPTGTTPVVISSVNGILASDLDVAEVGLGRINIATDLLSVRLFFAGRSRIFVPDGHADAATALAALQTALNELAPGSVVKIDSSALATLGYQITIEGYDPTNPLVVTLDQGEFSVLASNAIETMKTVEQRDEAGDWHIMTRGGSGTDVTLAIFGSSDSTSSEDKYITANMTIEQLGPRLIERPVWEDLNGDGVLDQTTKTDFFADNSIETDKAVDKVTIAGSSLRDYFLIGHEVVLLGGVDENGDPLKETKTNTVQVSNRLLDSNGNIITDANGNERNVVITIRGIDVTTQDAFRDEISVDGGAGDDRLIAGLLPQDEVNEDLNVTLDQILWSHATDLLKLTGGAGSDRIVGTNKADIIDSGLGDDIVTGGGGVDQYADAGGTDTLTEVRNLNFMISDAEFRVSGEERDLLNPELMNSIDERELADATDPTHKGIGVFEKFIIFGGAGSNSFAVTAFTKSAWLDGTEGSDTYVVTLTNPPADPPADPLVSQSEVYITDTGTGSTDTDSVLMQGGDQADTIQLDADTSRQEVIRKATGNFLLTYHGKSTSTLTDTATEAQVRSALLALMDSNTIPAALFSDVIVKRTGTAPNFVWSIELKATNSNAVNAEGKFFHLGTSTVGGTPNPAFEARVSRATVTRIIGGVTGLLDGKPDIDAMFERPAFETQVYNILSGQTGSYVLTYNGQATSSLSDTSTATQVKTALQALTGITSLNVTGSGTNRDPFRITLIDAVKDSKGNYLPIGATSPGVVTAPMEAADAAATTRLSGSVAAPDRYQRVFYDRTAEVIGIHGGRGDDTFIVDDSMAALVVYGDEGSDNFIIGRVIKTKTVTVNGIATEAIDGLDGVTAGVSYNAEFYGGADDDYFEVNHNVGILGLFGEAGDDMFFLKAQLLAQDVAGTETIAEATGEAITAGAGDVNNNIAKGESNILINYLENNRVTINGGSGFDTVVLAGTSLGDTFYIFLDGAGNQYLYGSGLKLENIEGVERLALVTGAGNDVIYLYGLKSTMSLLINTGTGNDQIIVGGEEQTFEVTYPTSSAVYTVEQQVVIERFKDQSINYNDLQFNRRTPSLAQKQEAYRDFFKRWVSPNISAANLSNVTIDLVHWALLEANLATALKLYAQAIELATSNSPIRYLSNYGTLFQSGFSAWVGERNTFLSNVNSFEQSLQNTNSSAWRFQTVDVRTYRYGFLNLRRRTVYSSSFNWALQNGHAPKLPSSLDFETLTGVFNVSSRFYADGRSLDKILMNEYLRYVSRT